MCQDVWTDGGKVKRISTIIGVFVYVHSYSVEGQSLVNLVVFVQSKSGCK